ncbi:MAG: Rossmann-like domain-containing protein [Dissulfurimicrobium sp.]|uniref:Rossmann-like domain-containing protein n=1 Tax=Dissulfurimicrobium TaxID=1769732 RepID=UPI003C757450
MVEEIKDKAMGFYSRLKQELGYLVEKHDLFKEHVTITAKTLTPKEAIGEPERMDFPLLKGKEVMIEARFLDKKGQAYTSMPGDYQGTIEDIIKLSLSNDFERACLISSLNAVMRHLGSIEKTIHCRNSDPERCATMLPHYIQKRFGKPKIAFIGFQPAMINSLSGSFELKVIDLDEDNINKEKYGVIINGPDKTDEIVSWADIIIATGSTCVNATIEKFIKDKPVIFYGVSIAGIAKICGYERYCPCAY